MARLSVKCTVCNAGFPTFFKTRNGKIRNGYDALLDHIDTEHTRGFKGFLSGKQEAELAFLFMFQESMQNGWNMVAQRAAERREWASRFSYLAGNLELERKYA